jgi:hypothetical protein
MATLAALKGRAIAELQRWEPGYVLGLHAAGLEAQTPEILRALRLRLPNVLEQMPDPGLFAPTMRAFSLSGATYIALYLVLHERGLDAAETWKVCDVATRHFFHNMRGFERSAAGAGMFSLPMRWLTRWMDARSRDKPLADWSVRFREGDGSFDFGVDYERCAIHALAVRVGAEDFAPYICLADQIGSEIFGWGLARTETIAQGGTRCDFRFRKGGTTNVVVRLPVVSPDKP